MSIIVLTETTRLHTRSAAGLTKLERFFVTFGALSVFIPLALLALSFVAGGLASASILFVYLFGAMITMPFVLAGLAICAAMLTLRQLFYLS